MSIGLDLNTYYCWRCECDVPMLDEKEWDLIFPLLENQLSNIKEYRKEYEVDLDTAIQKIYKPATEKYFELTGYLETNYAAIWHHRLASFGQECPDCGHLLRTAKAKLCANCGYLKPTNVENINSKSEY